jgi:hypothetical protein
VITVGLFQTIGADTSIRRLFRAGWRDVARRAEGRGPDERRWASRMLDRVGLLLPRLAARKTGVGADSDTLLDALVDMRTGVIAGRLRDFDQAAPAAERSAIGILLAGIGAHFRALDPRRPVPPPGAILEGIDRGVAAVCADGDAERRRQGLVLLTSLRRNLFPSAPGYEAAA